MAVAKSEGPNMSANTALPALWRQEYPFQSHSISIDMLRYHYVDTGPVGLDEEPTLLCVHGNPTWSFYYRRILQEFGGNCRALAVDHIGCGFSDKPKNYPYTLETHTRNLVRFVESLDLKRVVVVVHDWGGAIGLGMATQLMDRIAGLVILNTGAFPPPFIPKRISICRIPILGSFAVRRLNGFALAATTMALSRLNQLSPAARAGLLAPYDSYANRVAIDGFVRDIPMKVSHPTYVVLEQLEKSLSGLRNIPTRFVWGMKDWCFTPECLHRLQSHLPHAETLELSDVGHYVMEEAPDEVNQTIAALLQQVL